MSEHGWLPLGEALAWMMANVQTGSELRSYLSQPEAWRELRSAAADEAVRLRLRGARIKRRSNNPLWDPPDYTGPIPCDDVWVLWYVKWCYGSLALVNETIAQHMNAFGSCLELDQFPAEAWVSVEVSQSDLERVFCAANRPGPESNRDRVLAEYRATWPGGCPKGVLVENHRSDVQKHMKERLRINVATRTLQAYGIGKRAP